jgi:hypothetical protein
VRGRRLHPFQQFARAALGGVAFARQALRFAYARGESIAQPLELCEREQMRTARRGAGGGGSRRRTGRGAAARVRGRVGRG